MATISTEPLRDVLEIHLDTGGSLEELARLLQVRFPRPTRYGKTWGQLLRRIHAGEQVATRNETADKILIELGLDIAAIEVLGQQALSDGRTEPAEEDAREEDARGDRAHRQHRVQYVEAGGSTL